jgi:ATP-dependent Clp protease ATP-binding subunit ClpA
MYSNLEELAAMLSDPEDADLKLDKEGAEKLKKKLKGMVLGQDHVIDSLVDDLRVQMNKAERNRPLASVIFLGPSGTGKTELAKALTESLYKREENMVRVDGANMKDPNAISALIGNQGVYRGAKGGTLTGPVAANPKRVVLFDELEKAHPDVQDLFLTMSGEGKLKDNFTDKDVDFTKTIVIVTTNAEHEAIGKLPDQYGEDVHALTNAIKKHLLDCKIFPRTEVMGRFKRVHVFKPLPPLVQAAVAIMKLKKLAKAYKLTLGYVDPRLIKDVMDKSSKMKDFGMRAVDDVVDEVFGEALLEARDQGIQRARISLTGDGGIHIEEDPAPPAAEAQAQATKQAPAPERK